MRLPFRHFRQLRGIERGLRRSEPHMAAMLAIFARLNAGEAITSIEQAPSVAIRMGRSLAVLAGVIAALVSVARWIFRRIAGGWAAVRRRFSRSGQALPNASSAARDREDPGRGRSPGL